MILQVGVKGPNAGVLETELNSGGHALRQIWREKDVAVYQYNNSFELVIIRVREAHTLPNGTWVETGEVYPATSQWGQYGWSFGPQDRLFVLHIAKEIVDLNPNERIPRIHWFMNRWKRTRASLNLVKPPPRYGDPGEFDYSGG
jgi:hypothetical protein